ncbi:MAG: DUF4446 family protein [Minisyncoccota bacterium]
MASLSPMIIIALLSAVVLALSIWLFMVERRLRKLLAGKNAQSLEGVIGALGEDIRALEKFQNDTTDYLKTAEARLRRSIQGVETIRFNAFKGTGEGGNQSFAIALLSEDGDGAVVSSLYARDRMSVFAKPIKNFSSEFEMTAEERDAVARAKRS